MSSQPATARSSSTSRRPRRPRRAPHRGIRRSRRGVAVPARRALGPLPAHRLRQPGERPLAASRGAVLGGHPGRRRRRDPAARATCRTLTCRLIRRRHHRPGAGAAPPRARMQQPRAREHVGAVGRVPGLPMAGDPHSIVDEIEEFLVERGVRGIPSGPWPPCFTTNIVGSTERAAALGDRRWPDLLTAHDVVVCHHLRVRARRHRDQDDGRRLPRHLRGACPRHPLRARDARPRARPGRRDMRGHPHRRGRAHRRRPRRHGGQNRCPRRHFERGVEASERMVRDPGRRSAVRDWARRSARAATGGRCAGDREGMARPGVAGRPSPRACLHPRRYPCRRPAAV